jgi:hypothetical protein
MRRIVACALLLILLPAIAAEARKPRCTLRAHLEGNANDGEVFASQIRSQTTGRAVFIQKAPVISENDVVGFKAYPAADGSFGVLFDLSDHGKLALDTLSVEKRGTYLYVFVNSKPVAELQIDRRVSDGKLYVASGLSTADIELMKAQWRPETSRSRATTR